MHPRAAVFTLLVGLALAACGGKKKQPDGPVAVDGIVALPAGVRVVLGGDVDKLVASRLVRRGVAAMLATDTELKTRVEGIVTDCNLEPGESVESFLIGLGEGPTDVLLVVTGTFEENALSACVQKRLTEGGGRLSTKLVAKRTAYRAVGAAGEDPVWFALGSPTTLVVAGSEAWMAKGLGEGPRFTDDPKAKAILAKAPTDATVWATGWVPKEVAAQLEEATKNAIAGPKTMVARVDFAAGISAELTAEMASDKDANALKLLADAQRNGMIAVAHKMGLGRIVAKLRVTADGAAIKLAIDADEKELSDLLAAVDSAAEDTQNPPSPGSADAGATKAAPNPPKSPAP